MAEQKRYSVGIDIGGTHFRIGAVSPEGEVFHFRKLPSRQIFHSDAPLRDLSEYLASYRSVLAVEGIEIEAVAIGFPATLDRERMRVLQAPNLSFMENLPVVATLTAQLNLPVFIERDVTMALCYDAKKYDVPMEGIICAFYFGTGIGNAICIDGRPLIGKNGTAGELGHIPADGSDLPCGCGNVGCMENLAGGKYLAHLQQTRYPDASIDELFALHGGEPQLLQFVDRMAECVATEINILDPDFVLLGGGVPAMKGFPRDVLNSRIRAHTRKPRPAENLSILYVGDEDDKGVVGAALYARQQQRIRK